ncbi:Pr5-like receptor kinase [Thalictrum thalictroides]|uniref:Pr5-like receptor kinase n=1 Tax=Thalictrum thalictroides TaxID=46969 RepID=A0A7J6WM72_THATH|nr:Pr5-like receptor kinase [Thalictrum thalictroides]
MENPSNLVQNFGYLCTRMDDLKHCRDQVEGRRRPEMDGWLKRVKNKEDEIDKLCRDLDELNAGCGSKSLTAKHNLNKKVLDNLRVVEHLKEEFNAGSESVNASLEKLAKRFSMGNIKKFILTFLDSKLSGDDGDIYTGQFEDKQVAVKVLPEAYVVDEIFITEVSTIARASHRHVLKLCGFCFEGNMRALVYEYMENGPFDKILYENHLNLKWEMLYNIAIKTAKGILYLHQGCGEQIIHHDIRAHNVLLDKDLSPNVTGFGLAKLLARDVSDRSWTRTRGYPGYAAPEMWQPASRITAKCDVYSFGVMLFEILGKRTNGIGRNCFSYQVWEKFQDGQLDQIVRDCGIVEEDHEKAKVLTTLALWCVQMTPEIRPSMNDVVMVLEKQMLVISPPNPFQPQPLECMLPLGVIPRASPTIHERYDN